MENLNQQYLKQLQDLVEGNEHFGKDVIEESHKVFNAEIHFQKILTFDKKIEAKGVAGGGTPCRLHFLSLSDPNLEKLLHHYAEKARFDKEIRKNLLSEFLDEPVKTLKKYNDTQIVFHEFEQWSLQATCESCKGSGRHIRYEPKTIKIKTSKDYFGNIKVTETETGRGSYEEVCGGCDGFGYVVSYFTMQAIAKQKFYIRVKCDQYEKELLDYLVKCSTNFIADRTHLAFTKREYNDNQEFFSYEAQVPIMEFIFHIKTERQQQLNYKAVTFFNPPFAFQRPPFFDQFFTDEIELLQKINADGKISKDEALTFFKKFQAQPVLDQAMKNIVKLKTEDKENLKSGVLNACQNYMSDDRAQAFSNLISLTLDRLAPGHSKKLWEMGSIVCAIIMFIATTSLGFAIASDIDWVEGFFLTILALCSWFVGIAIWGILLIIPLFFILFFILILLSYGSAFFIRRQLSEEYRQGFKDFRILLKSSFQKYCTIGAIAGFVFSGIFGVIF